MGKDKNVCLENRSLNYLQEAHKYFFFCDSMALNFF